MGYGGVLVVPTSDIEGVRDLRQREGLQVTLGPEDTGWAKISYGLDFDGYEVMSEQFR